MKKTTLFSLLTALLLGSSAWADEAWVKTDPSDLQTGDVVAIVETVNSLAMPNNNGTAGAPAGVSVTVSGDQLENAPDESLQWVVTASDGTYQFGVADTEDYLYCTNGNNGVRVGTNTNNEFTISEEGYLYNTATSRYIGVYLTNPDWRCYTSINNNIKDQAFGFFKLTDDGATVTVAKPVITPAGGTFTEPQEVTITAGEGCAIYYTTDGTEPEQTSGRYTGPFTVSESCTVKAVAVDAEGNASNVATATFTFTSAITSIAELCAAPAGTVTVQFIGWTVTGIKGTNNAYFTDGTNGILLYQNNHGFEVGDQLMGTATFKLTSYNGAPEITGLSATTEGVTIVAKGVELTPIEVNIADLDNTHQGNLIVVKGVTYDGTNFVDGDDNSIQPYNTFGITMPTLTSGETYNATGVFVWYKETKEIAPRTAEDFALVSSSSVEKPVITPEGGTYTEAQTVTITAAEGLVISYTTDGSDPFESSTAVLTDGNTVTLEVSESTVVRAVAVDETGAPSDEVTAEYNIVSEDEAIPTIAQLCALATEAEQSLLVRFNEWVATGINGNQVYFTDGVNGIVLYERNHGFELGDKLTGSAVVNLVLYNECAEVTGLTAGTEGISIEKGAAVAPQAVVIADLEKNMQGNLIRLEGVTYADGVFTDDDDNTITPYNTFRISDYPTLLEGKTYNVTGVAIWYKNNQIWEIAPRTAGEFELVTSQIEPEEAFWNVDDDVVADLTEGTLDAHFFTSSDGTVTYTSSNEEVATIDGEGNITLVGRGITTITASVAETETYLPVSKSFTLTVTEDGYADVIFAYNDEDINGQGAPDTGAELTATRGDVLTLYANKAYAKPGDTHIKIYGSKYEGKDEERVLSEPSYIQLSVPEGYVITDIILTATGESYIKEWADQDGTAAAIEGNVATWSGELGEVVLTNQATSQARIKTIAVSYRKTGGAGITGDLNGDQKVDIADAVTVLNIMAAGTNDAEADLNGDGKVDIADFVTVLNIMAEQ